MQLPEFFETIGQRLIWARRIILGLSTRELAAELERRLGVEVSHTSISRYEADYREPPIRFVEAVGALAGVPVSWLISGGAGEMAASNSDEALINEFLLTTGGMLDEDIAAALPALSAREIAGWRQGNLMRLSSAKAQAMRDWLAASHAVTTAGDSAPNYEGLGVDLPGYEKLLERPRRVFDRFMYELIGKGLGREDLEELGRGLLNPIAALNTLHKGRNMSDARSEEDQMMVLNGMMPVLRKIVREGGLR